MPVADYHWADPQSDHNRIMEDIAYIRDHKNVFCVLNGDLMNAAIKSSVSDCYASISPMEELKICMELFEPIREKIMCIVPGNHERRIFRETNLDETWLMAKQLGIEDRYSAGMAVLFIRFGRLKTKHGYGKKASYSCLVCHGNGGGRKEGGKIQRLVDLSTIIDCDVYICGHTHLPAMLKDSFARVDQRNNTISYGTRIYVNTSAKIQYGGYGEVGAFKVPCMDTPIIHLDGTKKEVRGTI